MKKAGLAAAAVFAAKRLHTQGKTPPIDGDQAIHELRMISVNDTKLAVMIRGKNRNNPVLLCVSGGPGGTDIPIIRKYDEKLEECFTVVHYDQRGAGKSLHIGENYHHLTAEKHVNDLLALTAYICYYLDKENVYLMGHSYGTYIALLALNKDARYYKAYIGIGQMADTREAEYESLQNCIRAAEEAGCKKDVKALKKMAKDVESGKTFTPRSFVRKYHFDERINSHMMRTLWKNVFLGPEYSLLDGLKLFYGSGVYAMPLVKEALAKPLSQQVKSCPVPLFIIMGKYDGMTAVNAAKKYFDQLVCDQKEMIVFENSAHSPHIEENEKFTAWMCSEMLKKTEG